ncbi:MAG: hypothetical protein P8X90_06505 [Desulfobacterales bacterium]|jgi:hypothetical protein
MRVSIPKMKSEYRIIGFVAVYSLIMVLLAAGTALGDAIDDGLPSNSPAAVKASARQAVQNGLPLQGVVSLTRAMLQNNFNAQQVQLAHALMIEAQNSGMPVQPLINKAFEGMAKNVLPPLIVNAMETVQSRNAFAFQRAAQLTNDKSRTENLGRTLAAGLAAGLSREDADKITKMVHQRAASLNSGQAYSLAFECFQAARDVSRLGVSSQSVTNIITQALNKGFTSEDMHTMRSSFITQAQHTDPQNLARGYSSAIQEGKAFQGGSGAAGGRTDTPGPGGGGGAAAGGSGSGGAGVGGGGSGTGGSGTGGGSSGASGGGSGGSGGSGPGSGNGGSGGGGASGPGGAGNQ